MPRIEGTSTPDPLGGSWGASGNNQTTTVKLGETALSEVAKRLGRDEESLRLANPKILDSTKLKPGQEIQLPDEGKMQELSYGEPSLSAPQHSSLPSVGSRPLDDPLAKGDLQLKLSPTFMSLPGPIHTSASPSSNSTAPDPNSNSASQSSNSTGPDPDSNPASQSSNSTGPDPDSGPGGV